MYTPLPSRMKVSGVFNLKYDRTDEFRVGPTTRETLSWISLTVSCLEVRDITWIMPSLTCPGAYLFRPFSISIGIIDVWTSAVNWNLSGLCLVHSP